MLSVAWIPHFGVKHRNGPVAASPPCSSLHHQEAELLISKLHTGWEGADPTTRVIPR
jgi:hypothetical protein